MEQDYTSLKKTARFAGLLYLAWVILGIFGFVFLAPLFFVPGDAVSTANNILSNEFMFRISIVNDILTNILWVFIVLVLYRMLKQVDLRQAKLMVALVLIQIPAVFFMEALNIAVLMLLKGEILTTFEPNQVQDLSMLMLKVTDSGVIVLEMFWGLWLLPFGLLVYKSGFIPKIFGVFLLLNCVAYVIHSLTFILFPNYQELVGQIAMPFWILGEISITLWLLIKGASTPKAKDAGLAN